MNISQSTGRFDYIGDSIFIRCFEQPFVLSTNKFGIFHNGHCVGLYRLRFSHINRQQIIRKNVECSFGISSSHRPNALLELVESNFFLIAMLIFAGICMLLFQFYSLHEWSKHVKSIWSPFTTKQTLSNRFNRWWCLLFFMGRVYSGKTKVCESLKIH